MRAAVDASSSLTARVAAHVRGPGDVWLFVRMLGWSVWLSVGKRIIKLQALVGMVRPVPDGRPRRQAEEDRIIMFAHWATRLTHWAQRGNCLERGLIAYRYLTAINAQPTLVIGVRLGGTAARARQVGHDRHSAITGHAWVELDGQPMGERLSAVRELTPILSFGPEGEPGHESTKARNG